MSGARWHATRRVEVALVADACAQAAAREVAVEEPLELRVAGERVATTMRTPGDERALALGFLYAEGVIRSRADVGSVYLCGRPGDPGYGNVVEVTQGPGVSLDIDRVARASRSGVTTSACGICGRESIDDLLARIPPARLARVNGALLARAPLLLSARQDGFARTGGLHAACAIDAQGVVLAHAEDVGRHNAVDKVVGKLLLAGYFDSEVPNGWVLAVSGRASFEIVQKAAMARFAAVASVSAPSSLAVETACAAGLTLACFVRDQRYTLYTDPSAVVLEAPA